MIKSTIFARTLRIDPQGDDRLRFLGEAAYAWLYAGHLDKAAAIFDGLTVLAPNDPVGHLGIADVLLSNGRHEDACDAVALAVRAANIDRRTMACAYAVRGQALLGLGRRIEAEVAWRAAGELDPSNAWTDLAEALSKATRRDRRAPSSPGNRHWLGKPQSTPSHRQDTAS